MKRGLLFLVILVGMIGIGITSYALPIPQSGTRTYSSGISAFEDWANTSTSISWNVGASLANPGWFTYTYTWTTSAKDLSHIIIEVTSGASANDFIYSTGYSEEGPQNYSGGPGNPGLPAVGMYGIKIDPSSETHNFTFSFDSNHEPTWGDFYAKDGGGDSVPGAIYAYNAGFSADPPDDGLEPSTHIVVPDGVTGVSVPEPGTLLLVGVGLIGLVAYSRRRK